jgi:hypothetical protein
VGSEHQWVGADLGTRGARPVVSWAWPKARHGERRG